MGKITTGNRLYFYQLFSEKIGVGKQVLVPRAEEVLAAEDIEPEDLEFDSVLELLEVKPDGKRSMTAAEFAAGVQGKNPTWEAL